MDEGKKIGLSLSRFQAALTESGSSLDEFVTQNYIQKWTGDAIYHAMSIRTALVNGMHNFLTQKGLLNLERVSISPVTDPLAHDIEYSPTISYKGQPYKTTHSMIYSKFLACFNPKLKGIFVDSPNIRLEIESATGVQRNKYLVDFSQMDLEFKRKNAISLDQYYNNTASVIKMLREEMDSALEFFEDMIIYAVSQVVASCQESIDALGVKIEVPQKPFPRITRDEAIKRTGTRAFEEPLGKQLKTPFFWVTGLMRENYDLIYPYLNEDGTRRPIADFSSEDIYNYDLCAQSIFADGTVGNCFEVLSGALREWLYEPIVERLIDNKIISTRPKFTVKGELENIDELEGYGPFLIAAYKKDKSGNRLFPCTAGGGIGVERLLFAMLNGPVIKRIDDVTLFGKNPDSYPIYLY